MRQAVPVSAEEGNDIVRLQHRYVSVRYDQQ